jgi:hypothetical protein
MDNSPRPNDDSTTLILQRSEFLIKLLRDLAAACRVELSEATLQEYAQRLVRYPQDRLKEAFERTIWEWNTPSQFPPLSFIRERLENRKLDSEQAWAMAQRLLSQNYNPDFGGWFVLEDCCTVAKRPPALTPAIQYAITQCGGPYRMQHIEDDHFPFMRRDFLLAYERYQVEGGAQMQLTRAEAAMQLENLEQARKRLNESRE